MKLESKHLYPYGPYDLTVMVPDEDGPCVVEAINKQCIFIDSGCDYTYDQIKLVLHPLSDLTNHAAKVWGYAGAKHDPIHYLLKDINNRYVEVHIWQELLEGHYDVFGLIEKGLAIDINKIKQ